jgi:hypothetical protein
MFDLQIDFEEVCTALDGQSKAFDEATLKCYEAINGMSQRMERIEKWILEQEKSR